MVLLSPLDGVFELHDLPLFIDNGLLGKLQLPGQALNLILNESNFLNQLELKPFLLNKLQLKLFLHPSKTILPIIKLLLKLLIYPHNLLIMSFCLLLNQFLIFRDLSVERLDWDILF